MTPQLPEKSRAAGGVKCEINVTPLVDVCLVLLIIFMVVAPLIENRADLPETAEPQRMAANEHDLELAVDAAGGVVLDEKQVATEALPALLSEAHRVQPSRRLTLKADRTLRYEQVRGVLKVVADAGFSGAGLAMRKKDAAHAGLASLFREKAS